MTNEEKQAVLYRFYALCEGLYNMRRSGEMPDDFGSFETFLIRELASAEERGGERRKCPHSDYCGSLVEQIRSAEAEKRKAVTEAGNQFVRDMEFKIGEGVSAPDMDKHYADFKAALKALEGK